jgi:hypothetical protein
VETKKPFGFQLVTVLVMKSSIFWDVIQLVHSKSNVLEEYAASIFRPEE